MVLVVKDDVKISEFINLSAAEKLLPAVMTSVKPVRISKVDKVIAMENDSLSDVDLLKGVKLVKDGYVCLAGFVVSLCDKRLFQTLFPSHDIGVSSQG